MNLPRLKRFGACLLECERGFQFAMSAFIACVALIIYVLGRACGFHDIEAFGVGLVICFAIMCVVCLVHLACQLAKDLALCMRSLYRDIRACWHSSKEAS